MKYILQHFDAYEIIHAYYLVSQGSLPPVSQSWKDPNTQIFVGVSHYRDNRCSKTVQNIFSKAKYPARVFVGKHYSICNFMSMYAYLYTYRDCAADTYWEGPFQLSTRLLQYFQGSAMPTQGKHSINRVHPPGWLRKQNVTYLCMYVRKFL